MRGLGQHLVTGVRLYLRNRMAMLYGYLFPTVFLLSFYVYYRFDRVPLVRHMGEVLTVTILGGACFGLATTLVSERERGVWRRFKLVPAPTGVIVASTVVTRYLLLLSAGLLQLLLARALGMPWPLHPFDLLVAFTCASFAFLGVGLVLAMLADNVPAVQALGQSIFLPMLMLGGVAVPIAALPEWAQRVSAFFPGRYSVEAIQSAVGGDGLPAVGFSLVALAVIGVASAIAAGGMFRWDSQQRFMASQSKGWLALALVSWVAVGGYAVSSGHAELRSPVVRPSRATATAVLPQTMAAPSAPATAPTEVLAPAARTTGVTPPTATAPASASPLASAQSAAGARPLTPAGAASPAAVSATEAPPMPTAPAMPAPVPVPVPQVTAAEPQSWREVRLSQIEEELVFNRLPPDSGVVTPVASLNDPVDGDVAIELENLRTALQAWAPGKVADLEQRVRNLLYVPAVIDVFQYPTESLVPLLLFEQVQQEVPSQDDLLKILFWIALHPDAGSDAAVDQMRPLGVPNGPSDIQEVRGRLAWYAVKLIGRITGKRPAR
jgi:ABC-type polysaccharide/polyol phosphate export permease